MKEAPESRPLVWITGAQGLIGSAIVSNCPRNYRGRGLARSDVDLTDHQAVAALFNREKPTALIHCAAISRNPVCDAHPDLARKVNTGVTEHLAGLGAEIPFIFFSTDLVFDGNRGNYVESDPPNPLSVYAETKVVAEEFVSSNPRHTVVRTSLNGGISSTRDRGFNEEMQRAWRDGRTLTLFTDEFRCPIAAVITARAIWELLHQRASGIYHLAGAERLSRYEIGSLLAARHPELQPKLVPGFRRYFPGPPRPPDTSLNCGKIQSLLSFELPRFSDWIRSAPPEF
jgi:dTDP-4-dehydrorhamnose reductase